MNIQQYRKTSRTIFLLLVMLLLAGCGIQRRHEFVIVENEASEPIGGWVVTPSLLRFDQGSSDSVEECSLIINAVPTSDVQRYRLGIDSVEFILPDGSEPEESRKIMFENRQTEAENFTRRYTGLRWPTTYLELTCRVHLTLVTLETGERWSRSADYRIKSRWHRKVWFGKRK